MSDPIRIVFAGTPRFALPALDTVAGSDERLVAVYTRPDRRAGRGRRWQASPVKQRALALDLPVEQPETLKNEQARKILANYAPDLLVVVAYGLILPPAVLALPRHGAWNLHASLLPRWRGAAPIQRALLAGDGETGVCLMQMVQGLDQGPVLARRATPIGPDDTAGALHDRLARLGADMLEQSLSRLAAGTLSAAKPQEEALATYAAKLDPMEARLDWSEAAPTLARKVRAFNPVPGARAVLAGEAVKLWRVEAISRAHGTPGEVVRADPSGLDVATGDGHLRILELQRPGKRRVSAADYLNARPDLVP